MFEQADHIVDPASDPGAAAGVDEKKKRKKRDKVRSAWISFVGRIVAQIVGAAATIGLGVLFVHKYASADRIAEPHAVEAAATTAARTHRTDGVVALAVLPLQNFSGDPRQDSFADGMTEALITDLAQIERLQVISRTSSMHYRNQRKPLRDIARELGVDVIVEGSVTKAGDRVRITAQLIDANTDAHLWARSYDRNLRNALSLQAEIASAVARDVQVVLPQHLQERVADRGTVDTPHDRLHPRVSASGRFDVVTNARLLY